MLRVYGSLVAWSSKKQPTVSLSTAEAEYIAASSTVQEILWMRTLLSEIGHPQTTRTLLHCDNQAAIATATDDKQHTRMKHIDIRHHFIRDQIALGALRMQWCASADQHADILTKALGRILYERLRHYIVGEALPALAQHSRDSAFPLSTVREFPATTAVAVRAQTPSM